MLQLLDVFWLELSMCVEKYLRLRGLREPGRCLRLPHYCGRRGVAASARPGVRAARGLAMQLQEYNYNAIEVYFTASARIIPCTAVPTRG